MTSSRRLGVVAGAVGGGPPFWLALSRCFAQGTADAGGVEIFGVNRSARLLAPGFVERSLVDWIESQLIDKPHDFLLGGWIVSGDRQRDASGSTSGRSGATLGAKALEFY